MYEGKSSYIYNLDPKRFATIFTKPPLMSQKNQQPRTEKLTKKTSYMPCALSLSFFNYLPLQTYNFAAKPAQPFTSRTHTDFVKNRTWGGAHLT